jgi:hypothetical protein
LFNKGQEQLKQVYFDLHEDYVLRELEKDIKMINSLEAKEIELASK